VPTPEATSTALTSNAATERRTNQMSNDPEQIRCNIERTRTD
jgi:hypothetical protein